MDRLRWSRRISGCSSAMHDHEWAVKSVVAAARSAGLIPPDRVHLFEGIGSGGDIVASLGTLATMEGPLVGQLCGRETFKVARTVVNVIAVACTAQLESNIGLFVDNGFRKEKVADGLRVVRLLLSIDRNRHWIAHITFYRLIHAINRLLKKSETFNATGPDLLADLRSWVAVKPQKAASQKDENNEQL